MLCLLHNCLTAVKCMFWGAVTRTISSLVPEDMDRLQILNSIQKISWTFKERLKDTDDGMSHKYVLILSP